VLVIFSLSFSSEFFCDKMKCICFTIECSCRSSYYTRHLGKENDGNDYVNVSTLYKYVSSERYFAFFILQQRHTVIHIFHK
jgi:hypothetical protein